MNKTININLGGVFFHIDETAYQKLKRYIDSIRRSLSDDPKGRDEIIADIEQRISELLSEKVADPRQVVSENDIDEIISVMGQPEDYMVDEELFSEETRRTYRGERASRRRLFRDGEDKFLGGVSSGIAYYFDVDVIWIRIAWLIAAFGFGFGFLLYIILWILLPEARTTAEKLQMEGEPVTITNIEKRVRAEFEDASARVKDAVDDVTGAVKEGYENVSDSLKKKRERRRDKRGQSGIQEFIDVIGKIIVTFFAIIGKFIGVILIIVAVSTLIALVVGLFTAGTVDFMGADWMFDDDFVFQNVTNVPIWVLSLLMLVLVGIPFLMLFFLGLFIISGKSQILSRTAKFVLLGIWLIALLSAIFIGVKHGAEFARDAHVIETKDYVTTPLDTLSVKMQDNENLSNYFSFRHRSGFSRVIDENDNRKLYSNDVTLYFKETDSANAYVKIRKEASGRTRLVAKQNAEEIQYDFKQLGTTISFDGYLLLDDKEPYRNQDVRVTMYIPVGQVIYIDESTRSFLGWIETTNDMYRRDMPEHYFKMTDEGLECLDCKNDDWNTEDEEKDGVKVNLDEDGLEIKINDDGEKAEVKVDENGVRIN
ncbi:MAG: PspC domain-containing protein [Flavobacteriaceae bacterium]|nr:PspC domain-containing protein [Flavobacteriaceae bacterium]